MRHIYLYTTRSSPLALLVLSIMVGRQSTTALRALQPNSMSGSPTHLKSLLSSSDTWGNLAVLTGTATIAQPLGTSTTVGRCLGPPVTAMAISFTLASIGVLPPGGTDASKSLQLLTLQLATPLLLLGANVRRNRLKDSGPMTNCFLLASLATLLACSVGWYMCKPLLSAALGKKDATVICAALLAKNIGGGINYVAVCNSLKASPEALAAGLCVDNIFGLVYFPVSSALAAGRPDVMDISAATSTNTTATTTTTTAMSPISLLQLSIVATIATTMIWLGQVFGGPLGALPMCTLLTVFVASSSPLHWIQPLQPAAQLMGNFCLYLFFATAGAPGIAVAESVRHALVPLGCFNILLYGIHGLVLGVASNFNYSPQRLLVASSAAIGGPATAAALAQAHGWTSLLAPSLLVGNVGYAIATFIALAYHAVISR